MKVGIIWLITQSFLAGHTFALRKKELPDTLHFSLTSALAYAILHSIESKKANFTYKSQHWMFRSFQSQRLPRLEFETRPLTFYRRVTQRYDSESNRDVYRPQQTLNSFFTVRANQTITRTGGKLYFGTQLNRLLNYSTVNGRDTVFSDFTATPFSIGLEQPLFAFNEHKWNQKINPLIYQKSKQDYLFQRQELVLKTVEYFFDLVIARANLRISKQNRESAKELYAIGKRRYELGTISSEDLLALEFTMHQSEVTYINSKIATSTSKMNFSVIMGLQSDSKISLELPSIKKGLTINIYEARDLAHQAHPDIVDFQISSLEARRDLEKTIRENRFKMSFDASYGLNNQSNQLNTLLDNPLDQQLVAINFSVPLLDFGERKGKVKVGQYEMDRAELELKQKKFVFDQELYQKVTAFNLQEQMFTSIVRARNAALKSYEISKRQFRNGNIDILKLNNAITSYQSSEESYLNSLKTYWTLYFEIQKLTLYDFINEIPITANFSDLTK